jgi:uncharacterized protein with von Willebrand factor type A (vWA) domain
MAETNETSVTENAVAWAQTPVRAGEQQLAHDAYDLAVFARSVAEVPRLAQTVAEAQTQLAFGPALLRDLFWSFYKRVPRLAPAAPDTPDTPEDSWQRQLLTDLFQLPDWQRLRASGTVNDELNSTLATLCLGPRCWQALPAETRAQLKQGHAARVEFARLCAQAESLQELAAQAPAADRAEKLRRHAERLQKQAARQHRQAQRLASALQTQAKPVARLVRQALRSGLAAAQADLEQHTQALNVFGGLVGDMASASPANSLSAKLALAQQVAQTPKLQQLAALAGRFQRLALEQAQRRIAPAPEELAALTQGQDLSRVTPVELVWLADARLTDWFVLKFAEQQLTQYELAAQTPEGRGPLLVALDESASMAAASGGLTGELWSKAVVLALLAVARREGRDCAVLHFAGRGELFVQHFPSGAGDWADVRTCAEHFFRGGTDYEGWMNHMLTLVQDPRYARADVICLSDGLTDIAPAVQTAWQQARAAHGMRAYGVLLGTNAGAEMLTQLTDAVFQLDDLQADEAVLRALFAV